MNKWLLRLLRQTTRKVRPTFSALLIREIGTRAKRARNQRDFIGKIRVYANGMARSLQRTGRVAKKAISQFMKAVEVLAEIWTFVFSELWKSFCQTRILLLRWLKPSLRNSQVPEKIDLVPEEVKCRLLEEYWPPTRQRCDSIPLCLFDFAERFPLHFC